MIGSYLILLILSLSGLLLVDRRYKLVFFKDFFLAIKILIISLSIFTLWDIFGIKFGIFFIGRTNLLIGLRIGQFPAEEIFFLLLLNYTALVIYTFIKHRGYTR